MGKLQTIPTKNGNTGTKKPRGNGNGKLTPIATTAAFNSIIDATKRGMGKPVIPVKMDPDEIGRVGRPSKYKAEYCDLLVHHLSQGNPLESFAAVAHVVVGTLYDWMEKYPEFKQAKELGEPYRLAYWLSVGKALVLDDPSFQLELLGVKPFLKKHTVRTVGTKDDPQIETVDEYHVPRGNTGSFVYMMANMFNWRNVKSVELTGKDGAPIRTQTLHLHAEVLGNMTSEELRVLEGMAMRNKQITEDERGAEE